MVSPNKSMGIMNDDGRERVGIKSTNLKGNETWPEYRRIN